LIQHKIGTKSGPQKANFPTWSKTETTIFLMFTDVSFQLNFESVIVQCLEIIWY